MSHHVLLDTGVIVALLDRSERHHTQVVEVVSSLDAELVTCEAVIAEACYIVRNIAGAPEAVLENVERGVFQFPLRLSVRGRDRPGLVITQGSHLQVTEHLPNQISAINLSGDKDLIVFSNDDDSDKGYAIVVTLTGGTITFASSGTKIKDSTIVAIYPAYISETSAYVAFQVGTTLTYKTWEISGYTVTAGSEVNFPAGAAGYPLIFNSTIGLVLAWRNSDGTPKFEVLSRGAGALKVLGAFISKGFGDTLYLTAWGDNGELIYQVRAMSDLSLTGAYSLGACTEEELTAKTYLAMPYAVFGDDAFFYLYGRFAPSSVGLSQIIYSADSGVSLTVLLRYSF